MNFRKRKTMDELIEEHNQLKTKLETGEEKSIGNYLWNDKSIGNYLWNDAYMEILTANERTRRKAYEKANQELNKYVSKINRQNHPR